MTPHFLKEIVSDELQQQLDAGIIRKSRSSWSAALHVVQKPDGGVRLTVYYKPLNRVIETEQYPLPAISDLYAKLAASRYFTKIDMKSVYHQIPIHPDSIKYTAFICEFGLFEYLVYR